MLWDLRHWTKNQDTWVQLPTLPGFPSDLTGAAHLPAFSSSAAEHPPLLSTALLMETILQKNWLWTCEGWLSPVAAAVLVLPEESSGRRLQATLTACHQHSGAGMSSRPAVGQHSCGSQVENLRPTTSSGVNSRAHFLAVWKGFELLLSNQQPPATPLDWQWTIHCVAAKKT